VSADTPGSGNEPRRPEVRAQVALMSGYHSPQLDVRIRLNTNEAPVSPPEQFLRRVADAVATLDWKRYPDRAASELRSRIAILESDPAEHPLEAANVFAANGSNEVLQTISLAYGGARRTALTFEPTYALHAHISKICGATVIEAERREDFTLDASMVVSTIEQIRPSICFLCSPNNPTGMVDADDVIIGALAAIEKVGGLLVVDEAYGQFAPRSALRLVDEARSLVVTRTFSKTWSMAAARLGYAIGPTWLIDELDKVVLPYHLDAAKQAVGVIALDYVEEMRERVRTLVGERERVAGAIERLDIDQWPSAANFILFRPRNHSGDEVWQTLVDHSVLVRNCASWPRLENCLRVTLGTAAENDEFLAALATAVGSAPDRSVSVDG